MGVVHLGLHIGLQISGIVQFDIGATVGYNGYLPPVADFDFTDVGIFENSLLRECHVDLFLAGRGKAKGCAKNEYGFNCFHSLLLFVAFRHCEEERRSNLGKRYFWTASCLAVTQSVSIMLVKRHYY